MPGIFILADNSYSMNFPLKAGGTRRDKLVRALAAVVVQYPGVQPFAFSGDVMRADPDRWPQPKGGGTDMATGLKHLRQYRPDKVIVLCDGEVDDAQKALKEALLLNAEIHAVYIGDEDSRGAIAFMRQLAQCSRKGTAGKSAVVSLEDGNKAQEEILALAGPPKK
jgi:hypothetical protein